jgi:hypothetical protein
LFRTFHEQNHGSGSILPLVEIPTRPFEEGQNLPLATPSFGLEVLSRPLIYFLLIIDAHNFP